MDWIRGGLRFECQPDCGKCCSGEREGSVYLEPSDIERLAGHLGLGQRRFALELARRDEDGELELKKAPDGSCIFLSGKRCLVYEARPLQCRAYPFLPLDGYTPLDSESTWRDEKTFCPGIGKGRFYSKREIAAIVRGRAGAEGFEV